MNNFIKRALSGILFVAIFIVCIVWGRNTFGSLFIVVVALAINEFCDIIEDYGIAEMNRTICTIAGVLLFGATYLFLHVHFSAMIFLPYLFSLMYIMISEIYQHKKTPMANWAFAIAGQIYIALPLALLNFIAFNKEGEYSFILPLSIFIFLWLNDTGAYLVGSLLHKKIPYKLAPRISPNKTWVGSIGGGIVVLIAGAVLYAITNQATIWFWLGMGAVVSIFGTYGDLIESQIKRQVGIKDSGKFLPGHGGVLDRFDSSLMAIPAVVIYTYCVHFPF